MPFVTLPYVAWAVPLGLMAVVLLSSCYLPRQGYHLIAQQVATRPISSIAEEDQTRKERELFAEVAAIRRFATEELGLTPGDSYTTYYRTDRDHLVDVVSAAGEFSFDRKEWWFPVFGRFPYKGFYRREPAEQLAGRLKAQGWDVIVRPVDAFSTLGYFTDPVISFMADYSVARLAELIIHESAHATLWLRGESQFNEEFATFVGRMGAEHYLAYRHGADSDALQEFLQRRRDQERFRADVQALKAQLQELYHSYAEQPAEALPGDDRPQDELSQGERSGDDLPAEALPMEARRTAKQELISSYQREFADRYDGRYETDTYRFFAEFSVNNAYLDLFETYSGNIDQFHRFHDEAGGGELPVTIAELTKRAAAWKELPRGNRPDPLTLLKAR
ncbi:MAG: aminopeptidase [Alkalispirochaeta sp.]